MLGGPDFIEKAHVELVSRASVNANMRLRRLPKVKLIKSERQQTLGLEARLFAAGGRSLSHVFMPNPSQIWKSHYDRRSEGTSMRPIYVRELSCGGRCLSHPNSSPEPGRQASLPDDTAPTNSYVETWGCAVTVVGL